MTIITPAQLNIEPTRVENSTMMAVPAISFRTGAFSDQLAVDRDDDSPAAGFFKYGGPLPSVVKAVVESLTTADIVHILAPSPNSTYVTEFFGPALRCTDMPQSSALWSNMSMNLQNASVDTSSSYYYLSWPGNSTYPWVI